MTEASCFTTGMAFTPRNMCLVNGNLVVSGFQIGKSEDTTRMYDQAGRLLGQREACHPFVSLMALQFHEQEIILEGCTSCKMIYTYKITENERTVVCEQISPKIMSVGLDGSILIFDEEEKSIQQLHISDNKQFEIAKQFRNFPHGVAALCYSRNSKVITILHSDKKTLTGIDIDTGRTVWHCAGISRRSSDGTAREIQHICALPDGTVCVFNYREILALSPTDGTILCSLLVLKDPGIIWAAATSLSTTVNQAQKLAFAHDNEISVYDFPLYSLEASLNLPLHDVAPNLHP